jgi:aminoglycoside phosphotransferase (APT) family kinase protein
LELTFASCIGFILLRISKPPDDLAFTPATGQRLHWDQLPEPIRSALESRLGAAVTQSVTQPGGFSPGVAARLRLADGRRVFIKAVGVHANPDSPGMHRREARIAVALPASVPTPRLLAAYDDGEWIALVFEDVDGVTPVIPWRADELDRVLGAITGLSSALTPAPLAVESVSELMPDVFNGWQRLAAAAAAGQDDLRGVDPWVRRHLADLVSLEAESARAADGTTLLHADLRADNVLLTPTRVLFVDWPWASRGAAWVDLLFMLPSIAMQGGPKPWQIFNRHPLGQAAPAGAATAVLAAVTGFFVQQSRLPAPPGLPTLRAFQRDQGVPALEWLRQRWSGLR